jgi:RND family efflux transporter MFP subunit
MTRPITVPSRTWHAFSPLVESGKLVEGLFLVLLALFSLGGCKKQEVVELPPPIVTVTQAVEKQVQDWDEYTGRLAPMGTVDVRPRVSGYITEVKFIDGDLVKKGQPLFIIDPRPYQADYDQAKAELDKADAALKLASADFDRARQLRDKGVTAAGDFDQRAATFQQATGAFQSARAALAAAQLNLEFCTVTAPIDGRAGLANVTVGNLVSADGKDPLTTIVSTNPVYAYADVDERSLLRYVIIRPRRRAPRMPMKSRFPSSSPCRTKQAFRTRVTLTFSTIGWTRQRERSGSVVSSILRTVCLARDFSYG